MQITNKPQIISYTLKQKFRLCLIMAASFPQSSAKYCSFYFIYLFNGIYHWGPFQLKLSLKAKHTSGPESSPFFSSFGCVCFGLPDDFPKLHCFTRNDGCKQYLFLIAYALFVLDNRSGFGIHNSESVSRWVLISASWEIIVI